MEHFNFDKLSKKDKKLFLSEVSARLPYKLKGRDCNGKTRTAVVIYDSGTVLASDGKNNTCACGFIPYLRSLNTMTNMEKENLLNTVLGKESLKLFHKPPSFYFHVEDNGNIESNDFGQYMMIFSKENVIRYIKWMYKHHFNLILPKYLYVEMPKKCINNI